MVTDIAGKACANALVTVLDAAAKPVATLLTNTTGKAKIFPMMPGQYSITVQLRGFETLSVANLLVQRGVVTQVKAELKIAPNAQTAPIIDRVDLLASIDSAQLDTFLGTLSAAELPVATTDENSYLLLLPATNAVPDVNRDPEQDVQERTSFRGLSQTASSSQLDGMGNNQALNGVERGGPHTASGFSSEAVQAYRVNSGDYSARYSGTPGAVVNAVSRHGEGPMTSEGHAKSRGTKTHGIGPTHGTGFVFLRDNIFDATNPYSLASTYNTATGSVVTSVVKPEDLRMKWGGTAGGSVRRFTILHDVDWFLAYEQQYRDFPVVSSPSSPTFFSLTASQTAVLANRGVTGTQISNALQYLAGQTGISPRTSDHLNFFPRLDWQIGERDRFTAEYNRLQMSGPASGMASPVVQHAANGIGTSSLAVDTEQLHWVHFLTEDLANEAVAGYAHELAQDFAPSNSNPGPQVSMGVGGLTLGTASYLPRSAYPDEHTLQIADTITWVHGKHTVSGGGGWSRTDEKINALRYSNGAYHYNSIVDWISDYTYNNYTYNHGGAVVGVCSATRTPVPPGSPPSTPHYECFSNYTQAFGANEVGFSTNNFAAYVEDNWKLNKRLTLSAGVRYEYEQLPSPQLPNSTLDAAFSGVGSTSVYPEDRNNAGPRIGFAWDPFGKGRTTVRAGYGVYFGRVLNSTLETGLQNTGYQTCDGSIAEQCRLSVSATVTDTLGGYANVFPNYTATAGIAPSKYTRNVLMGERFRVPTIQQGELDIEHEFGRAVSVSGSYLVSLSRQLPNMVDANISPAPSTGTFTLAGAPPNAQLGAYSGETFLVPYYQTRINTNYGPVSEIISNINGYYNAMVLRATRRLQHGLAFDAHWTWSKAIDYGQTAGGLGVASGSINNNQFDPYQIGYDRGLSDYNLPHKLVAAIVAEPHWRTSDRKLSSILNKWEWTPLMVEQSGYAYSYNIYGGVSLAGGHESINRSGGAAYLPTVGRDTLRMPDTFDLDLRLARHFTLGDHLRMEVMIESYNLVNHQDRAGLITTAYAAQPANATIAGETVLQFQDATQTSTPFGQYIASSTSRYGERQMQFGVRVHF